MNHIWSNMLISFRKSRMILNEKLSKSSSRSVASWYIDLMLFRSTHSMRICLMDIGILSQNGQFGMGLFSMRYPWVSLVWPILILWMTTSSLLSKPRVWKGAIMGMISLSLMSLIEITWWGPRANLMRTSSHLMRSSWMGSHEVRTRSSWGLTRSHEVRRSSWGHFVHVCNKECPRNVSLTILSTCL